MVFQERTLACAECGSSFAFTVEEQQFHSERGYTNEPKRCPACRESRRSERRTGGGGGFGSEGRQMHPVVCAQCGKDTEVPFRPRGDRPVYCSDCYSQQRRSGGGGGAYGGSRY